MEFLGLLSSGEGVSPQAIAAAFAIAFLAGLVKGAVGFAMPMILISGLAAILGPEAALAALILPTLATNTYQALRGGLASAFSAIRRFRLFLGVGGAALFVSSQFVTALPDRALLLVIGLPVSLFALLQLAGWRPGLARRSAATDIAVGGFAGAMGGMSGVWGPPTVLYLTALDTPKSQHVQVQGVIYFLGSLLLLAGHVVSGILNADTIGLSSALVLPAGAGMALGLMVQDRFDQAMFRKATLVVLLVAGLNLLRRALF